MENSIFSFGFARVSEVILSGDVNKWMHTTKFYLKTLHLKLVVANSFEESWIQHCASYFMNQHQADLSIITKMFEFFFFYVTIKL